MGNPRKARFLLKLPTDEREELRLCKESGVGLLEAPGDFVSVRAGETVFERGGDTGFCCAWRRCWSSGGA